MIRSDELSFRYHPTPELKLARRAIVLLGVAMLAVYSSWTEATVHGRSAKRVRTPEDYSKFLHSSDSHLRQACTACHARRDNSTTPTFPGHKACTGCHSVQFFTPIVPMCNICHSGLSGGNPPLRAFPTKFDEPFNVKFDHAQHDNGEARPSSGCASCHSASLRRGVAMTIPVGIAAHKNCYQCHTPGKTGSTGRDISNCDTCHASAPFRRTPTAAVAFNASFRHDEHGPRQRLNCSDCHSLKAGLPQSRQVTSPRTAQHFPPARSFSCASCHNNKRAFGEKDYDDCARCHDGATFKFRGGR